MSCNFIYIISEALNSSSKSTCALLDAEDDAPLVAFLRSQKEYDAFACDINTAICVNPFDSMCRACQMTLDLGMEAWVDSSDAGLSEHMLQRFGGKVTINSVTAASIYRRVISLAAESGAKVVAMPRGGSSAMDEAMRLVDRLISAGIDESNLYLDIMSGALIASERAAVEAIRFLDEIKRQLPKLITVCGISNISYGLPERDLLNASFLTALATHQLDAAICDIRKPTIREAIATAELLCGRDELCAGYVAAVKNTNKLN